jgi:hypothetical protein
MLAASVDPTGSVNIHTRLPLPDGTSLGMSTPITYPIGIIVSPDESRVVAFNDHRFVTRSSLQEQLRGKSLDEVNQFIPSQTREVSPPIRIFQDILYGRQ